MNQQRRQQWSGGSAPLKEHDQDMEFVLYWLSRPVEERVAEVERLRQQYAGDTEHASQRRLRGSLTGGTRPLR